jgi:hypothetical protein
LVAAAEAVDKEMVLKKQAVAVAVLLPIKTITQ